MLPLRPLAAFFKPEVTVFYFFFFFTEPFLSALNWLTSGFVYATLSFNRIPNYFMSVAFWQHFSSLRSRFFTFFFFY